MKKAYVPTQHGAWSMLALPYLLGLAASPSVRPAHALLFACWLAAYLLSYPVLQWIRTGKSERYKEPAFLYGGLLLALGAGLLAAAPELIWFALALLPLFLVNLYYARTNNERALANDLAAVVMFSSVVFPVAHLGGGDVLGRAPDMFALSILYFAGTVFYVKTVIRERNNPRYYMYSVVYHLAAGAAAAILIDWRFVFLFLVLTARAAAFPKLGFTPKKTGITEFIFSVLVLACAVLFA